MERRDRFQNLMQEQGNNKPKRGGNPLHISINRDNANAIVYELKDTIAKQAERPARILIEGLPLYYLSPQNNGVKSWYSEIFKKGWQYVDFISQSLRKPNAILPYKNNLQVTTLLDNTYQTKSVKDAYMLSQMDTRLTKFAKTYIPPRTLRHVIEKRIVKLEKDYNPGNNRSEAVRDAMYQLEKFFDKDGKLRTDQLFIVVHPSTYTDQQKKMIATLFSLIKGDDRFTKRQAGGGGRYSDEEIKELIEKMYRHVWIDPKGEIQKSVTKPVINFNDSGKVGVSFKDLP